MWPTHAGGHRAAVEALRERLRGRFGEAPVERRDERPEPAALAEWREGSPGHLASAEALVGRRPEESATAAIR